MVTSQKLAKSSQGNQFFGHLPINDRHFDYKQKFRKNKKTNIDPSPSLIMDPTPTTLSRRRQLFLPRSRSNFPQFPRRIPASLSRSHIDCGLMFQRVFFLFLFFFFFGIQVFLVGTHRHRNVCLPLQGAERTSQLSCRITYLEWKCTSFIHASAESAAGLLLRSCCRFSPKFGSVTLLLPAPPA